MNLKLSKLFQLQSGKHKYVWLLGFIVVYDANVNKGLLKQGLAWHYKQYNKDEELAKLEQEARKKKIGLWSQPNPVAPWDYRRK